MPDCKAARPVDLSPSDPVTQKIAELLVRKHGPLAAAYVEQCGEEALRKNDPVMWQVWQRIKRAVEELIQSSAGGNDTLH